MVLEDMMPRIRDIPNRLSFALTGRYWTTALLKSIHRLVTTGAWPLQEDHIRIRETDLLDWSRGASRSRNAAGTATTWPTNSESCRGLASKTDTLL